MSVGVEKQHDCPSTSHGRPDMTGDLGSAVLNHARGALTESQLDRFRDKGYLRIGVLLDDALIGSLREEYDRVFAEARATDRYRDLEPERT